MNIFSLDTSSDTPLFRQLYGEIRKAILDGRLPPGSKLASSRELAMDLNISRNTVMNAYEQLLAEGYIYGQTGSGSYVAELFEAPRKSKSATRRNILSARGKVLAETQITIRPVGVVKFSFRPGTPALESFPFEFWGKLLAMSLRNLRARDFHYGDPAGHKPLREAIANYLNRSRGVRCHADQVLIVNGSQQVLDLSGRILLDPGDTAWIEDPVYGGARAALKASGARICSVPVDSEGLQWKRVPQTPAPRLIYITPSHQFPLGVTMSLQRRLSLLKYAKDHNAWILEDDYDSEFRYDGRPLAALQGLDENDRVIYTGTFSKVMFAGLRLGYVVVPQDLVPAFVNARAIVDRHSPILEQAALAEFINSGRFDRHIRKMRKLYAGRQKKLVDSVNYFLRDRMKVDPSPAGMHLIGWLHKGVDDRIVSERAAERGIEAVALSAYFQRPPDRGGLLLGYSALPASRIHQGIEALAGCL